jgi:hypothetical protein
VVICTKSKKLYFRLLFNYLNNRGVSKSFIANSNWLSISSFKTTSLGKTLFGNFASLLEKKSKVKTNKHSPLNLL